MENEVYKLFEKSGYHMIQSVLFSICVILYVDEIHGAYDVAKLKCKVTFLRESSQFCIIFAFF